MWVCAETLAGMKLMLMLRSSLVRLNVLWR
jgi:hypothetical protein